MSTPIESNTEQLQEVLQQVYNLPNKSGGSAYDLVIPVNIQSFESLATTDIGEVSADEVNAVHTKLTNGEPVRVLIKGFVPIDSGDPVSFCGYPAVVHARIGYPANTWLCVEFTLPMSANSALLYCEIGYENGALWYANAKKISNTNA